MIPLFKKTGTGAIQTWLISTEGNVIVTTWGQDGGAMQTTRDVVTKGKNTGKKNATTPEEQASLEATAQWEKKLKKGYVQTLDGAAAGERDAVITGGADPMLAHRFDQHGGKLVFPCYVQPKFDGHRCIAVVSGGKATLWTRTRKPITGLPHIVTAIEKLALEDGTTLDGELYNHDYRANFELLTSFIRDSKGKPGAEVVQYHVYDLLSCDQAFIHRTHALETLAFSDPLVAVETPLVADEDEMMLAFERALKDGYEGLMARNIDGKYVGKRSYDLLKIKEFLDSEFLVVGVEEGRGKLAGHAIFVCKTADGMEFRAKLIGDTSALKQYFDDPSLAVSRWLTVKYQGLTAKNGVPRFPVAVRFRDDGVQSDTCNKESV